jgi:hypothetical protein
MPQNNPAYDIREFLIDSGVTTPIYIGKEPTGKDTVITLYNTQEGTPNPKYLLDKVSLQVRARSTSYVDGYNALLGVYDKLVGLVPGVINTTDYLGITPINNIYSLGTDKNNNYIFIFNIFVFLSPEYTDQTRKSF